MAWTVRAGTAVRYRNVAGRVFHAIVVSVTDPDTVNLRVGNGATKLSVTGAARETDRTGAGWYRNGEVLS